MNAPLALYEFAGLGDGKITIQPHVGQYEALHSEERFTFVIAGFQSGKTSFGPYWLWQEIDRCGEGDYLAVTATYDLFKLKMLPEMTRFFCDWLTGWELHKGDRVIYSTTNDTRIILRSANVPEGLESATAKAAWLDECGQDAFRLESWQAVQRRLALYQGRVLGTTTPYNQGWLKTEVYDRWRKKDPNFRVIQFASIMNPSFPPEEYERLRKILPDWKFEMFCNGNFKRPAGMIYDDYDEKIHLIDPIALKPEWPRYVGIDPGAVNTALIWLAEDPEKNVYYLYRESLEGEMSTNEHAREALSDSKGENVVSWACGAKSEKQQRMDWADAGVPAVEPKVSDVESGIDRVIELFKTKRLYIFNTCRGMLDEIGTYSRPLDSEGQPTEGIKDKEKYHRLDALRYNVQHLRQGDIFVFGV